MRTALLLTFCICIALPAQTPRSAAGGSQADATLIILGAKVLTMDSAHPRAEAIAIRGEWIIAVGNDDEIKKLAGPSARILHAEGRLVIPGFNDSHCHFAGGSRLLRSLNLYGVATLEKVLELVKEKVAGAAPGEWVTGSRYDHTLWGERWPTRADLDRVAPDNPVILTRTSGHSVWVNSLALKLSGITRDTPAPPAGEIQKDPKTGEPTGILLESAAGLVRRAARVPRISPAERKRIQKTDLLAGLRHAARLGVTSVQTSSSLKEMDLLRELKKAGQLTVRWTGWLPLSRARWLSKNGVRSGQGDLWVRTGFLKGYIDGTLGDGTAAMFEPFSDRKDFLGLPTMSQEELDEAVVLADRHGFQVGIHAIGDRGVHMALNAFERAALLNGTRDRRHRVEHAQLIKPRDMRRFGLLGIVASMEQTHCTTDMRFAEKRVGLERCRTAYAWRSLIDTGAMLAFGTDWSVEPLDPMRGVFSSTTRTNIQSMEPKTGWFPEQKLSVWEGIYYYTYGSAYGEHLENVKGSLAPGRLADLVVMDRDLFTIPTAEILEAGADLTIVGGRVVFERKQ